MLENYMSPRPTSRLRRFAQVVMGTSPYNPEAAEARFYDTVQAGGWESVAIIPDEGVRGPYIPRTDG